MVQSISQDALLASSKAIASGPSEDLDPVSEDKTDSNAVTLTPCSCPEDFIALVKEAKAGTDSSRLDEIASCLSEYLLKDAFPAGRNSTVFAANGSNQSPKRPEPARVSSALSKALKGITEGIVTRILDSCDARLEQWLAIFPADLHTLIIDSHFPALSSTNTLSLTASNYHPDTVARILCLSADAVLNAHHRIYTIELSAVTLDGSMKSIKQSTGTTCKPPQPGLSPGHEFGTLQPATLPALAELLKAAAPCLKTLVISETIITPSGAFHLSQLLASLQLEKLHLSRCQIGSQALQTILVSLETTSQQPTLTSFSLAGSRLYPACVEPLSNAVSQMTALKEFDMAGSIVSEGDTVASILSSVATLDHITHVNVQHIVADATAFSADDLQAMSDCGAVDVELLSQFKSLVEFKGTLALKPGGGSDSGTQPRSWPALQSLTVSRLDEASADVVAGARCLQELAFRRGGGETTPETPSLRALLSPQTDRVAFELLKVHLTVGMSQLTSLEVDLTMAQKKNSQLDVVSVLSDLSNLQELILSVRLRKHSAEDLMTIVASLQDLQSFQLRGSEDLGPTTQVGELLREVYGNSEPPADILANFKKQGMLPDKSAPAPSTEGLDWLTPTLNGLCKSRSTSIHTVRISGYYQVSEAAPDQNISDLIDALEQLSRDDSMVNAELPVLAQLLGRSNTSPAVREALLSALSALPHALKHEAFIIDDLSENGMLPSLLGSGNEISSLEIFFPAEFCSDCEMQNRFFEYITGMHDVGEIRMYFKDTGADPEHPAPLMDQACVESIGAAMCQLSNVRELRLCTVSCPAEQFYEALAPGIANQECFETLSVASARKPCCNLHCAPLVAQAPKLKALGLPNCHLNNDDVDALVEALLLAKPENLEQMNLGANREMTDKAAASLCRAFHALWNLTTVSIQRTGVSGAGMTAMCRALSSHPKLAVLNALYNLGMGLHAAVHELDTIQGDKELGRAFFYSVLDLYDMETYYNVLLDEQEMALEAGKDPEENGSEEDDDNEPSGLLEFCRMLLNYFRGQ